MTRKPLSSKAPYRQQISRVRSYGAPTRGWNARDGLANMKQGDAIRLRNWYPTTTDCVIRGGMADHATGLTGTAKSIHVYNAMNGTNKKFTATDSGIYDTSSAGAVGASVATSTNGYWNSLNFGDGTTKWLILVNGTDKPEYYSGAAWTAVDAVSTPALTGLTSTSIVNVFEHKGRLHFIEKDSMSFWYLAAGAAGGALSKFDLSSFASKGGYLIAGGTWSRDSGDGVDDLACYLTSEGQVIVYQGTNPSAANTWALVGAYDLPKPIGKKPLVKVGGDLVVVTQTGAFPLSAVLTADNKPVDKPLALTNRIDGAFNLAARSYGANQGWEGVFYPAQSALIFNIPTVSNVSAAQYVMNTITKAWCEFDSWQASCFAVFNGELYFGTGTEVKKAWTGTSDDGTNIVADGKEAFSKHGSDDPKELVLYRPILQVNGSLSYLTGCDVDFTDKNIAGQASFAVINSAQWDVDDWDTGLFASSLDVVRQWSSPQDNYGTWFAGKLKISTSSLEVHWVSNDAMFNLGSGI